MTRSKKLIIGTVLIAVLLFGSLGGLVLANDGNDNPQPRAEFLEKLADKLGITLEELQAKIVEVREELSQGDSVGWQVKREFAGHFYSLGDKLGIDIDLDALKAAIADAKERIQAGEDKQEVMAEVMAQFGIDIDALKAKFAENNDGERPFKRCFMYHRGMGGMHYYSGPTAPIE
jgi:transcriptional regulator with XRE-family HTH domain